MAGLAAFHLQQQAVLPFLGQGDGDGIPAAGGGQGALQAAPRLGKHAAPGILFPVLPQHTGHVPAGLVHILHPGDGEHTPGFIGEKALPGPGGILLRSRGLRGRRRFRGRRFRRCGSLRCRCFRRRRSFRRPRGLCRRGLGIRLSAAGGQRDHQDDRQQDRNAFFHGFISFFLGSVWSWNRVLYIRRSHFSSFFRTAA